MARRFAASAANDNRETPQVRVKGLDSPPLTVAEVEIFDALISNVEELIAANDNAPPRPKEAN